MCHNLLWDASPAGGCSQLSLTYLWSWWMEGEKSLLCFWGKVLMIFCQHVQRWYNPSLPPPCLTLNRFRFKKHIHNRRSIDDFGWVHCIILVVLHPRERRRRRRSWPGSRKAAEIPSPHSASFPTTAVADQRASFSFWLDCTLDSFCCLAPKARGVYLVVHRLPWGCQLRLVGLFNSFTSAAGQKKVWWFWAKCVIIGMVMFNQQ